MTIESMIKNILDGNITEAQTDFNELVTSAVNEHIENLKSDVFSEAKKDDEKKDEDEEDMKEEKDDDNKDGDEEKDDDKEKEDDD